MFFDDPETTLSAEGALKVLEFLRNFFLHYCENNRSEVTPSTTVGYIRSVSRSLIMNEYKIDVFNDAIFIDKKEGLVRVLENRCAQQKTEDAVVKHYNTLPRSDIVRILDHEICNPSNSLGYVYGLLIGLGIALGVQQR